VSEAVIFVIGAVIFAITIYGSVMAGGLALTRVEAEEKAALGDRAEPATVTSDVATEQGRRDD